MPDDPRLTDVRFWPGSWRDVRSGLLGYAQFVVGGTVRVDGVAVRRTRRGRLTLSYPIRKYSKAAYHVVSPVDDVARQDLERQVLDAIGLEDPAA